MARERPLAALVASNSPEYAFARRYALLHGWQSSCAPPCAVLNGSALAAAGLLPHPWAASALASRPLPPPPSRRAPPLAGRTLRIRAPVQDGFWVRPLFVLVQVLWASLVGVPFFVDPHAHAACARGGGGACVRGGACAAPPCDAYYDPARGENAWEQYFEQSGGGAAAAGGALVELDAPLAWLLYLRFDAVYPKSAALAAAVRAFMAPLVRRWVRLVPSILAAAAAAWDTQVLSQASPREKPAVLGVHLRGTDKNIGRIVTPRHYFPLIDRFVAAHEQGPGALLIFLATDDARHQQAMVQRYGQRVVQQNGGKLHRAKGNGALWKAGSSETAHEVGLQVILDTLLLSRVDFLLKSSSAVSEFAIYFSPSLANRSYDFSLPGQQEPASWKIGRR